MSCCPVAPEIIQEDFLAHRSNFVQMPCLVSVGLEPGSPELKESMPLPIKPQSLLINKTRSAYEFSSKT